MGTLVAEILMGVGLISRGGLVVHCVVYGLEFGYGVGNDIVYYVVQLYACELGYCTANESYSTSAAVGRFSHRSSGPPRVEAL